MATKHFTRKVGWGEALYLEVGLRSPGLKPVTDAIRLAAGTQVGSRNTFAKLFSLAEPPTSGEDGYRAWLLLTALGQDPAAWGISDDVVPPAVDCARLRDLVTSASGWLRGNPASALASAA